MGVNLVPLQLVALSHDYRTAALPGFLMVCAANTPAWQSALHRGHLALLASVSLGYERAPAVADNHESPTG